MRDLEGRKGLRGKRRRRFRHAGRIRRALGPEQGLVQNLLMDRGHVEDARPFVHGLSPQLIGALQGRFTGPFQVILKSHQVFVEEFDLGVGHDVALR